VTGFTGSPVWHLLYSFPPNDFDEVERAYEDVAEQFEPILDVFEREGVRFALEVHPTEIAYDFVTTRKLLAALDWREQFGINLDPSHLAHQLKMLDGRKSILGGHLNFGQRDRGWDFVSPGHGDVDFEALFRALTAIGYSGPLSIEWEDSGMNREYGAHEALAFVRRTDFSPSTVAFDAAMQRTARVRTGAALAPPQSEPPPER
jgi:sugar phosphate isomerase/epimerase